MKKLFLLTIVFFGLTISVQAQTIVLAVDLSVQACSGGNTVTFANTTYSSTGQPNRLCAFITNTDASKVVRCGDATTDATHGLWIPAGQTQTICVPVAISCCGIGGAVTVTRTRTDRQ